MASEGTRQGTHRAADKGAADQQPRLRKCNGMSVSSYRIVLIRDGQFVKAARRRFKAL
jgi:hypothetical protein